MKIDTLFDEMNGTQARIRDLNAERRSLSTAEETATRRSAAVQRHRRRLEQATAADRQIRATVRSSFSIVPRNPHLSP